MFPAVVNFKINIPGILSRVWIYMEVGRWLHAISLLCTISSLYFYQLTEEAFIYHDIPGIIVFGYFFLHMLTIPFFAELDAYSRFQNYKSMKDLLYHYGFQIRFIKTLRHSKCQREAAYYAARDLGYANNIHEYFKSCGYRWYHILPDFVWSHPEYLFSKHFWSTTFFTKTYHPKYYLN
jgi:hypothetical protein